MSATNADRLATSADFAAAAMGQEQTKRLGNIHLLRPYALEMQDCIDDALMELTITVRLSYPITEAAVACYMDMKADWDRRLP